jgi:hypothetical protein
VRIALSSVIVAVVFAAIASACAGCTDAVCVEGRCADQRADHLGQLPVKVPVPDVDEAPVASRSFTRTASDAIHIAGGSPSACGTAA